MENVSDSENDTGTVPLPRLESETETKRILITSEQERDRLYYQEQKRGIEKRLEGQTVARSKEEADKSSRIMLNGFKNI